MLLAAEAQLLRQAQEREAERMEACSRSDTSTETPNHTSDKVTDDKNETDDSEDICDPSLVGSPHISLVNASHRRKALRLEQRICLVLFRLQFQQMWMLYFAKCVEKNHLWKRLKFRLLLAVRGVLLLSNVVAMQDDPAIANCLAGTCYCTLCCVSL